VGEDQLFYDLSLREAAQGKALCATENGVALVDGGGKVWVLERIDGDFQSHIFADKAFPTLVDLVCSDSNITLASSGFVDQLAWDGEQFKLSENVLKDSEDFKGFVDVFNYLGNWYFLKPSSNEIVKYTVSDDEFTTAGNYLKDSESIVGARSLAVNGNLYLSVGDKIKRFEGGVEVLWSLKGQPEGGEDFTIIYTDSDLDEIFVLNAALNQIWVFNKEGFYVKQIRLVDNAVISDFALKSGIFYILSGSKIYETTL